MPMTLRAPITPSRTTELRAVVLLGGSVRASQFAAGIGRPVFDLPLGEGLSILDIWSREVASLAGEAGAPDLRMRVMVDRAAAELAVRDQRPDRSAAVETDPFEYRGTGGVLRDVAAAHEDDDLLLAGTAAQLLTRPLAELVEALGNTRADVAVLSQRDGTPTGLFLVRCGTLRTLPAAGFVDFKEQALPSIAAAHRVAVWEANRVALPIRNLTDYLSALRWHHRSAAERLSEADPFGERLSPVFGFAEAGAEVHPTAKLHDSVVLAGGRVEAGAIVVRSVVCPGGIARKKARIVDQLITGSHNGRPGGAS